MNWIELSWVSFWMGIKNVFLRSFWQTLMWHLIMIMHTDCTLQQQRSKASEIPEIEIDVQFMLYNYPCFCKLQQLWTVQFEPITLHPLRLHGDTALYQGCGRSFPRCKRIDIIQEYFKKCCERATKISLIWFPSFSRSCVANMHSKWISCVRFHSNVISDSVEKVSGNLYSVIL